MTTRQGQVAKVSSQSFFDALTKWIPSEVIAVWLLVQAAQGPLELPDDAPSGASFAEYIDFTARWLTVLALVVGAMVVVALMYVGRSREIKKKNWWRMERGWAFTILLGAPASAAAWVLGLPDSPLYDFTWYSQTWGVVLVAVTATAVAALAYALGVQSPDYPVLIQGGRRRWRHLTGTQRRSSTSSCS